MYKYTPEIYVACLASYNNAILHGKWIDANQSEESIEEEIQEMLANSPIENAEEWAIHDVSDFGGIRIDEHEDLHDISLIAENIIEHGELFIECYKYSNSIDETLEMINERFFGLYDSLEDFARETTDTSEIPKYLEFYIDYQSMARDMQWSGEIVDFYVGTDVAVFTSY